MSSSQVEFTPRALSSPFPLAHFSSVPHIPTVQSQFIYPNPGVRVIDGAYVIDATDFGIYISEQQPPLSQVDARIRIVRSQFLNPNPGFGLIDSAYVIDTTADVGHAEKGSQLAVKRFIKRRSFERGDQRDEDCSICFEDYRKHTKAVKTECNHVFHQHCISKWLLNNNSCPLCRKRVYYFTVPMLYDNQL